MKLGPAILFCPADRPDRYAKAADRADTVILDLEDAVAPEHKESARQAVLESSLDPERTIVRVNPFDTNYIVADLRAVKQAGYTRIMLPKCESAEQVLKLDPFEVIALCETARGINAAAQIAEVANVSALMWGAEDLTASLGGTSSRHPNGGYRDVCRFARAQVLLQAAAHGKGSIDSVYLDIADLDGLRVEAADAAASGFTAKASIHPSQMQVIRDAFAPSEQQVARARRLLDAAAQHAGVFTFEGQMVDEPLLRQARAVVEGEK
ncbi:HpcH/HpaI aldolase/citrate lyase family protein [Glutamicibacter soli]|uniref:HpcH/HpaI aldolase/citrate lyase family protein n=1 Tax=Glutamicibacter soli TaxID=453836 RepID=A0A6L9G935_9MICC|nr:CoA ester lyase [Glutamicibacter soli]NAZ17035.1 HpcH/HpaI aldolase/citrate lyase family protein [Glutamicibacter soli]